MAEDSEERAFDSQSMSWNYGVPWADPGFQISDNHLQEASGPHLDLGRAAYGLYGVKYIDPVHPSQRFQAALRNRTVIAQAINTSAPLGTVFVVEYTTVDDGGNTQTASRTVVCRSSVMIHIH